MTAIIPPGDRASVLFIGNSFTMFNDLPDCFALLARANGREVEVGMAAKGGESLAGHAVREETLAALAEREWDVVILQGHSAEPILHRPGMLAGARSLAGKAGSARLVAYMTWAYRDEETLLRKVARHGDGDTQVPLGRMQDVLAEGYREMAASIDAAIAPVGLAWNAARSEHPDWELFMEDGFHPTPLGTWVTTVVFYRCLFGDLPGGAPDDVALGDVPLAGDLFDALRRVTTKAYASG